MGVNEILGAIDMRLILQVMDALDNAVDEGKNVGLRFAGNIAIFEDDNIKGAIQVDEDLAVYVPASCRDSIPVIETESDGAK